MSSSVKREFTGDFYDADYYERGQESGKGWLQNYRWMPQRNIREALAYIDYLGLDDNSLVLDVGCAKGFIVKALNILHIKANGCDISEYALSHADNNCWNCTHDRAWDEHKGVYTHAVAKDVFEHLTKEQLPKVLANIAKVAPIIMCIIPMGDKGRYRIPEYHKEISHLICENEFWWENKFNEYGWTVIRNTEHVPGLKDNWQTPKCYNGNHVFVLKKD